MASSSQQQEIYGYADSRFQNVVSENLHCPICLNVLKEPKMCRSNQHFFCSACIRRHLQNSSTCPQCMEQLTVGTLSDVPRLLTNFLSELRINCDYFHRGCRAFIQLAHLESHVMNCGFAPVKCSNNGCNVEINKRDRVHHETELCDFRKVKCHECGEIRKEIDEVKTNQAEMKKSQAEMKESLTQLSFLGEMRKEIDEVKKNQAEMKESLTQLSSPGEMRKEIDEMKMNLAEMKEQLNQLTSVKKDIVDMKAMLVEVMKRMNNDQSNISSATFVKPVAKQSIIIAGGDSSSSRPLNSVEAFSWTKRSWSKLPAMKECRSAASCFVYQNQIMMAGGYTGSGHSDGIEMLKVDKEPLEWITFPAKLPEKLNGHKTVVYYDKLIVIGGYNSTAGFSNIIYEVLLRPPYSTKVLCRMPQPIAFHGAELINDEIFILGGRKHGGSKGIVDNVYVYDLIKNKCKQMPALPYAVSEPSTVLRGNKVIVIGGVDRKDKVLNKVLMYNVVTGGSEMLPSMKYERRSCSAVATADGVVVMGGWNEEDSCLKSVEYFNFGSNCWQELPPMIEAGGSASAIVTSVDIH